MNVRTALVALGTGLTVTLLTAVLLIEALPYEFSAIVGLPVGVLAGVVTTLLVVGRYGEGQPAVWRLVDGLAGFGFAVVILLAVLYVDLAGLSSWIDLPALVAGAVFAAVAVSIFSWYHDRS